MSDPIEVVMEEALRPQVEDPSVAQKNRRLPSVPAAAISVPPLTG